MVLTKSYLRYVNSGTFGVISSPRANVCLIKEGRKEDKKLEATYAVVPALENVFIWDVRRGEKIKVLQGSKSEVTCLCQSPDLEHIAIGYGNGVIKIWNINNGSSQVTFSGHKSGVTSLQYDSKGVRLVSGSKDTDVIIWDVISESGVFRLKGHKGMITHCHFLQGVNVLVTSSKDTLVKFWDLDTQHCFLTLVGHRSEVWGFTILKNETRLVTGSSDSELRVWEMKYKENISVTLSEIEEKKRKLSSGSASEGIQKTEEECLSCNYLGSIMRHTAERVVSLLLDESKQFLGCHGSNSVLEIFRVSSDEEINKRISKRKKKAVKKQRSQMQDRNMSQEQVPQISATVEDELLKIVDVKGTFKIR